MKMYIKKRDHLFAFFALVLVTNKGRFISLSIHFQSVKEVEKL